MLFLHFFEVRGSKEASSLAYIVIDGLDEAPEKERVRLIACLAALISRTSTGSPCRLQIAIFARPNVQGDPGFDAVGFQSREKVIEVTQQRTEKDISAFVKQRLRDVRVLRTLDARKTPEATRKFKVLAR